MLAFFVFAVLQIIGEYTVASERLWEYGLQENQNVVNCCFMAKGLRVFNMSRFAGDWQIWRNGKEENLTRNCEMERFKVEKGGLMSSEVSFFTEPNCNKYVVEKTYYQQFDGSNLGKFASKKNASEFSTEGIFQIFDTDYDSYAHVYRDCWINNDDCSSVAEVLVRHRTDVPMGVLSAYSYSVLSKQSLDPAEFTMNQCHPCQMD